MLFILCVAAAGCGGYSDIEGERQTSTPLPQDAVLYFHGMVYSSPDMQRQIGPFRSYASLRVLPFLAPELFDSGADDAGSWRTIEGFRLMNDTFGIPRKPWLRQEVLDLLDEHEHVTVAGYSLGRVPFYHLLTANHPTVDRAVAVDPTFNMPAENKVGDGGQVARAWLEGGDARRFLLVYGNETLSVGGRATFETAMQDASESVAGRFFFCWAKLDHAAILSPGADALEPGWEATHCTSALALRPAPQLPLQQGGWAMVVQPVNFRWLALNPTTQQRQCGLSGPAVPGGPLPSGTMLELVSGSTAADGYIWWQARRDDGTVACVAERDVAGSRRFLRAAQQPSN